MCMKLSLANWLNELRTNCEDYDFSLHVDYLNNYVKMNRSNDDDISNVINNNNDYQNIWDCGGSSTSVKNTVPYEVKYANECRISTIIDENCEEIHTTQTMIVNNTVSYCVPNNVIDWTTKLLYEYCSEDEDFMEYAKSSAEIDKFRNEKQQPFPIKDVIELRRNSSNRNDQTSRKTYHMGSTKESTNETCNYIKGLIKIKVNGQQRKLAKTERVLYENYKLYFPNDPTVLNNDDLFRSVPTYSSNKKIEVTTNNNKYEFTFNDSKSAKEFHAKLTRSLSVSKLDQMSSDTSTSITNDHCYNNRVEVKKTLLEKLGLRQPREVLEMRGIYRNEAIFGNKLVNLTKNIKNNNEPNVPQIIINCTTIVERPENIRNVGIYRTSGNIATIQKIRLAIDNNKYSILETYAKDCDVISGTLKLFFRELEESLISKQTFQKFVNIIRNPQNSAQRHVEIKNVMDQMHIAHRDTLHYLLKHLVRVVSHKDENQMSIKGMAIVWGPSLVFQSKDEICGSIQEQQQLLMEQSELCNNVIEMLLTSYNENENNDDGPEIWYDSQGVLTKCTSDLSLFNNQDSCCYSDGNLIFGKPLVNLKVSANIPEFIQKIVPAIEKYVKYPYLYDCVADVKKIDKIKSKTVNEKLNYLDKFKNPELAVALKEFFKLLPQPLIPKELLDKYLSYNNVNSHYLRELLDEHLEPIELCTLDYLIIHLINVIKMLDYNKMDLNKIVNVWTPILCRDIPDDETKRKYENFILHIFESKGVRVNTMSCISLPDLRDNNCDNINKRHNKIKSTLRFAKHSVYENF